MVCNLLKFLHSTFQLSQMLSLLFFEFFSFLYLLFKIRNFFLKKCQSLGRIIYLSRLLSVYSRWCWIMMVFPYNFVHPFLSTYLFYM